MPHPPPLHDAHALFSELISDTPAVNLSAPSSPAPLAFETPRQPPKRFDNEVEPDPEEPDEDPTDTENSPHTPSLKRPNPSPEQLRRDHHNTHTRRCRARLNWRFDALNRMLPDPQNSEVKHKVHILDHAIAALSDLRTENDRLRLLVALRSPAAVASWVASIVPSATTAVHALQPVLELLCYSGGWTYAEVWQLTDGEGREQMSVEGHLVKSSGMLEPALSALGRHAREARPVDLDREFAGSAFRLGFVQWSSSCIDSCMEVNRAQLLVSARLRTCLAVPVPVNGENTHVIALYDVRERPQDAKVIDFASFVAATVGNCFGAEREQVAINAVHATTPRVTPKAGRIRD